MKRISIISLLFFVFLATANAQFFQTGQDPSQIHWRQINTEHFQVIYPEEFDKEAQRLSFVLSKVYEYGDKTLNFSPRKVSVILHTRTVNSNGLVAWAPKRIELFTTPHQQIYAQDWLEQLALHEFRHLVQLNKIQSELPFLLKFILGEQAAAVVTGVYLPFWFLEGDAVVTETALSHNGRGRMASFSMEYRAQLNEKGKYSFDKAFLGSYKDFVPDHYKLGYWMVGKSREKYGSKIWSDVLGKVGNQPLSITPLNSVLKKETGKNSKQLYNQIFDDLGNNWKQEMISRSATNTPIVSPSKKNYTNYLYPEFYNDSLIFAYRTSIGDIGRFVLINPEKTEKIIYTPGNIFEESVSMKDQLIIWSENRADIRWPHADRSVILIFNIETKKKQEIACDNKLFSPVISPDLKSFAAVEVDPENNFFISVFDLNSGKLKERFKTIDNQYFFTPCWDEKGEKLYFVSLSSKGKCLTSLDLQTNQFQRITDTTYGNIKNPVFTNQQLIFSADFSGVDRLYSLNIESQQITEVCVPAYGADYPSATNSKNQILYSNYSASGYRLSVLINLANKTNQEVINSISLKSDKLADNLAVQEKGIPYFTNNDSIKYATKRYSKIGHLFNIHSWAPAYIDVNSYEIRPGFSVFSQNKLGTSETRLGYDYNVADRTGKYNLSFNYSGWFPEFNSELSIGKEASNYFQTSDSTIHRILSQVKTIDLDVRLPLNLSKGKYSRILYSELIYTLKNITAIDSNFKNYDNESYQSLSFRIYFHNLLNQSKQSLMPKWGQQFDVIYRQCPFSGNDLGTLSGMQSVLFFPGLTKNSGFKIYQGYQEKNFTSNYSFADFVHYPRGFQSYLNNKMYSVAADYKFPLFYPDFSFGKLAYIKRIKASLFYDYAWLSLPARDKNGKIYPNYHEYKMKSTGLELTSDIHVLRFFAPIEIGFRSVYRPDFHDFQFNLLLSINFNGF